MAKSALIVVDMQEDFCPPVSVNPQLKIRENEYETLLTRCPSTFKSGALAVPGGRELSTAINKLLAMPFTLKVATRDLHPEDHISFDTSHPPPNNKAFESSTTISNPQNPSETATIAIWPAHCIQGTPGAEIIPEIDISKVDRIIDKGQDRRVEMFSAFLDVFGNESDAASFDLAAYLKEEGVSRVFVVGLAGDYCVRCTAIDARKEGFEVLVVEESVKSIDEGEKGWGAAKKEFEDKGIKVVSIDGPEVQNIKVSS
ncbi:MAG: hypothetical protein Q9182_001760 [Xanthomendoza sp. 2 TL-2023]